MIKTLLLAFALLVSFGANAQATAEALGLARAEVGDLVFAPQTVNPSDQTIRHKGAGQFSAATAPSTFGAVGNAGGCPALETWSGGFFLGNASESTAIELTGCMSLLLANVAATIDSGASGVISHQDRAKLVSLCAFYQYRVAISYMAYEYKGVPFVCPIDDKSIAYEERARIGVPPAYADSDVTDPKIRQRAKMQPVYR